MYTVSDGRGSAATATVLIIVVPVNDPPTIVSAPDALELREGQTVHERIRADDPDLSADVLLYSASGLPPDLSLHVFEGTLSGTVGSGTAGIYTLEIEVSDGQLAERISLLWTLLPDTQQPDRRTLYLPRIHGPTFRSPNSQTGITGLQPPQ